jgi:hypothetical protein
MARSRGGGSAGWYVVLGIAAIAVFAGVSLLVSSATDEPEAAPAVTEDTSALRVVNVLAVDQGLVSDAGRDLRGSMLSGSMPTTTILGTVLSDAECTPDGMGVSHCRNGIALDDGSTIEVRHHHRMAEVACLTPGERVVVQPA